MNNHEFFAELDGLTEKEIEARVSSWDREQLVLVQQYLDQKELERAKAAQAAQPGKAYEEAVRSSVEIATRGARITAIVAVGQSRSIRSSNPWWR